MFAIRDAGFAIRFSRLLLIGGLSLLIVVGCASSRVAEDQDSSEGEVEVGYGTVDRDEVGGAVTTVDGEEVGGTRARTLGEMLQGQVAGVEVTEVGGGGLRVRIRGKYNSFMSGNEPLFVIDGMAIQATNGVLYGVNPSDVESITVLKDASSTAIYGSRGANGVIVIKTKQSIK